MERLTRRLENGKIAYALIGPGECVDVIDLLHVYDERLADYEDTGLEPQQITDLKDAWDMYGGEEGITAAMEELEKLRKHTPNDPLTLEELREMDGEIVYITPLNDWAKVVKYGLLYFGTRDFSEWRDGIDKTYGDSWIAYRRKPEEGTT